MRYFVAHSLLLTLAFAACGVLGGDEQPTIPGKIVFSGKADGDTYQLFLMNADGSDVRQLTGGEYSATSPAWSPDGSRIAFASDRQSFSGYTTLWVVEAGGGDWQPLVRHPRTGGPVLGDHPAWSPDGANVVFDECINCELGGGNHEIFVADLQAGTIDTLIQHPASERHPTWSPDGGRIAFISDRDYVNADTMRWRKDLYIVNPDGTSSKRLTKNGFIGLVSWHPQNNKIAFAANGLYMYNFSEGSVSKIKLDLSQEIKSKVRPVKWSYNGKKLLLSVTVKNSKSGFYLYDVNKNLIKQINFDPRQILGADWLNTAQN